MNRRPIAWVLLVAAGGVFAALGSIACGPPIDLAKDLAVTNVDSGYYDDGVKNSEQYLLPSITFALHNTGAVTVSEVQITVSFWQVGADGEWDSMQIQGLGHDGLAPGATTDAIRACHVASPVGYTLAGARRDFFQNPLFKDVIAKIFAQHGGKFAALGQFTLGHQIYPNIPGSAGRP